MLITEEQIQQFRTEGYFILEGVIPTEVVEGLRSECQQYIDERDREMEAKGVTSMGHHALQEALLYLQPVAAQPGDY